MKDEFCDHDQQIYKLNHFIINCMLASLHLCNGMVCSAMDFNDKYLQNYSVEAASPSRTYLLNLNSHNDYRIRFKKSCDVVISKKPEIILIFIVFMQTHLSHIMCMRIYNITYYMHFVLLIKNI